MYFKKFPIIAYPYRIKGKEVFKPMTDITANVRFRKTVLENISLYDEYDIKEGETPEIIAARIYGNPQYHWIIMIFNERYNYVEDFPKTARSLQQYIAEKYDNPNSVHHYENDEGLVVNSTHIGAIPVTNAQYEERVNESKRRIKLISPRLLSQILSEYELI